MPAPTPQPCPALAPLTLPPGCDAVGVLAAKQPGALTILNWREERAAKVRECWAWIQAVRGRRCEP